MYVLMGGRTERVLSQEERVWDVLQEFATHPDYDPLELQEGPGLLLSYSNLS